MTNTITTKQDLCNMITELIALQPQLTVKELTQGTTDIQGATLQVLTIADKLLNKQRPHMFFEKYVNNLESLSFEYRIAFENSLKSKIELNTEKFIARVETMGKEMIERLILEFDKMIMLVACTGTTNYNGSPVHNTISHYNQLKNKVEEVLKSK